MPELVRWGPLPLLRRWVSTTAPPSRRRHLCTQAEALAIVAAASTAFHTLLLLLLLGVDVSAQADDVGVGRAAGRGIEGAAGKQLAGQAVTCVRIVWTV